MYAREMRRRASVNHIRLDWNHRNRYDRAYAACGYFKYRDKETIALLHTNLICCYSIIMSDVRFNSLKIIENFCSLISVQIRLIYKKYEKLQWVFA